MEETLHEFLNKKPFCVMGVLNVTPDSFYDGGRYNDSDRACERGLRLCEQGADMIDIGGESTRPGAEGVSSQEEMDRVVPVVEGIRSKSDIPLSIDTTKASVAEEALKAGGDVINDISAGRFDPHIVDKVREYGSGAILMHSRERPKTMQNDPGYSDVMSELVHELEERVDTWLDSGVKRECIAVDPGIGFAKRQEDNISILSRISEFSVYALPVMLGVSRKSVIGHITGRDKGERLPGSLGAVAFGFINGIKFFRVHDAEETADVLSVLYTLSTHGCRE